MDAQWIPAQAIGHKPQAIQAAAAGLEDLVVTTCHLQALLVQSDGQVVHGASADGDEMDLRGHARVRLCLYGSSGAQSSSQSPMRELILITMDQRGIVGSTGRSGFFQDHFTVLHDHQRSTMHSGRLTSHFVGSLQRAFNSFG